MKKKHKPWVNPNEESQRKSRRLGYWMTAVASALFGLLALVTQPKKPANDAVKATPVTRVQPAAARP
jgi:hypothetical protein